MNDERSSVRGHRQILLENSVLYPGAFADLYSGGPPGGRDLTLYFGGATAPAIYETRKSTEPLPILHEFLAAVEHVHCRYADLLVIPNPPVARTTPDHRRRVLTFVFEELLPEAGYASSDRLRLLGYSYGAYLASIVSFESSTVESISTIGGIGMIEAAGESELKVFGARRYLCFTNNGDMIGANSRAFRRMMSEHGIEVDVVERPGSHSFEDYSRNGSVRHAFAFLLASAR